MNVSEGSVGTFKLLHKKSDKALPKGNPSLFLIKCWIGAKGIERGMF
ncbi:MAG: hypothetical protein ABR986_04345 [Methanomassiliicoccales archaeon]|jgi:hypothetical protein